MSVAESEMKELRERMALLITKAYFICRKVHPELSVPQCEEKALSLLQQIIQEEA